jgi:hypothetical protein
MYGRKASKLDVFVCYDIRYLVPKRLITAGTEA